MAQFLQRRKLRHAQIGDACAAGDPALGFAIGRSKIVGTSSAERHAESDVQILEPAEQRNGIELEIRHDRRPAPAGVAALNAVEAELSQLREQFQHVKADAADLVAAEIQLLELRERRQMLQADVGDLRERDVERFQLRQLGDVRQARIGDIGPAEIQRFQPPMTAQKRDRRIGDEFRRRQVQIFQLIERLQSLDAAIRHVGQRQVEPLQCLDRRNSLDVRVGRPRARERHVDDVSRLIADGLSLLRADRRRTHDHQHDKQPGRSQRAQS